MRFTIFYRLAFGYLTIILIMGIMDAYTLVKCHRLNTEVSHILDVDERILELKQKLSTSLIAQSGYERKYFVTGDPAFHDRSLAHGKDFNDYLTQTLSLADTAQKKAALASAKSQYEAYQSLMRERMGLVKTQPVRPEDVQAPDEEKAVEQILAQLKTLETLSSGDIYTRMSTLRQAANSSAKVTIIMVAATIILAIGTSIAVTHSITNPLRVLIEKTKEVSRGCFEGGLRIDSPPEVSELARTFDTMCEKLKEVDKVKSDFFSSISHELRTPLTAIKSGISLLRQGVGGPIPDKQERLLTILSEETQRMIELVNSVLDLSKMEAGMMSYRFNREKLIPLIEQVVSELTPLLEAKKIHLQAELPQDTPPLQLDRERILQVLRNLIGNALKFTPEGGRLWIFAGPRDGVMAFSVKDTGPGIPKEDLGAIFEKFHQFSSEASKRIKGSGLGLALVKHIIASHGGKVWVESEVGQGSVFTFTLPF
jgi:two-component system, NtrC family, sensor histidine kinase GlrK